MTGADDRLSRFRSENARCIVHPLEGRRFRHESPRAREASAHGEALYALIVLSTASHI